jgi:hypothetical protein
MTVIGALSSFREPGEMSPHKRPWEYRFVEIWQLRQNASHGKIQTQTHAENDSATALILSNPNRQS